MKPTPMKKWLGELMDSIVHYYYTNGMGTVTYSSLRIISHELFLSKCFDTDNAALYRKYCDFCITTLNIYFNNHKILNGY